MADIELEFFHDFCDRARSDGCDLHMAVDLIFELNSSIKENRHINPNYTHLLNQFLALRDVLRVQEIEWFPKVS